MKTKIYTFKFKPKIYKSDHKIVLGGQTIENEMGNKCL